MVKKERAMLKIMLIMKGHSCVSLKILNSTQSEFFQSAALTHSHLCILRTFIMNIFRFIFFPPSWLLACVRFQYLQSITAADLQSATLLIVANWTAKKKIWSAQQGTITQRQITSSHRQHPAVRGSDSNKSTGALCNVGRQRKRIPQHPKKNIK